MSNAALDNLASIGQLKKEARNDAELVRLLRMARTRLGDAQVAALSAKGRFIAIYNAAHAAALAALRWHGYRSENRYTVFQSLPHTLGWSAVQWRILDHAHQRRNMAEYEGFLEVEESTLAELCALVITLIADAEKLIQAEDRL